MIGPDGNLIPDLAGKLPGRGVWCDPKRDALIKAVTKGLFARSLKSDVLHKPGQTPQAFADGIEKALRQRVLAALGLARRSGRMTIGSEATLKLLAKHGTRTDTKSKSHDLIFFSPDTSERTTRELIRAASAAEINVSSLLETSEISGAIGLNGVQVIALLPSAIGLLTDVKRLTACRGL